MTRYTFTRIDNPEPIAKAYRLSDDGDRAEKDAALSQKRLSSCVDARAERLSLTLDEAATAFDALTTSQAVVYGATKNGTASCRLVSKGVAAFEGLPVAGTADTALRTRDCFEYASAPAFFMLDHDPKGATVQTFAPPGAHAACGKSLDAESLRALLADVMPEATAAPMIARPSGSTWMRRTSDGKQLRGAGGERLLVGVADGTLIPALAAELFARLVARGLAHIEISKSGALLARTPFDFAVYQPERFDFLGGAEVAEGLERNPPETRTFNQHRAPLDVSAVLAGQSLGASAAERLEIGGVRLREARRAFVRRMLAECPEMKAEAARVRTTWLADRVAAATARAESLKGSPLTLDECREIELEHARIADAMAHDGAAFLLGSFVLPGGVTVAQVLADPARYVGHEFADPLEPEYDGGRPVAAVLVDGDDVCIYSHAHGGYSLRLCRTLWDVPAPAIEQCTLVTAAGLANSALAQASTIVHMRATGEACALTFDAHSVFPSEAAAGFTVPTYAGEDRDDDASADMRPPHRLLLAQPTWFCSPADTVTQPDPRRLAPAVYEFKPTFSADDEGGKIFAGWRAVRLCSAVATFAEAKTEGARTHILLVRDTSHEWHTASVAAAEYASGGKLESALRTAGLHGYMSKAWPAVRDMLGAQQQRATKADLITALGWSGDSFTHYNTPRVGVQLGKTPTQPRLAVPAVPDNIADTFASEGTLSDWQRAAALSCGDWVFSTALAAAFAPVLLRPLNKTGAGLHLWGLSGVGKSTPLRLAKSVWGRPELSSWDTTLNGAVAAAAVAQDALTVYDEVGAASDPSTPPRLAYALVNGSERSRANQDGSARAPRQFRTVVLSSGEYSMADAAAKTGTAHHEGQEVRFLDVAVTDDATRSPAFRSRGARAFSIDVGAALADHYGHAGVQFVERLLGHAARFGGVRTLAREAFAGVDARMYRPDNVADNVQRARETFVLFATAGELAVLLGVLGQGWQIGDMTDACESAFRAWLVARAERGDLRESGETQRAERAIRDLIETTPGRWMVTSAALAKDYIGWYESVDGGTAYYVQDGPLRLALPAFSGAQLSSLLAEKGMVLAGKGKVASDAAKPFPVRLGGKLVKVRGFLIPNETAGEDDDIQTPQAVAAFEAVARPFAIVH